MVCAYILFPFIFQHSNKLKTHIQILLEFTFLNYLRTGNDRDFSSYTNHPSQKEIFVNYNQKSYFKDPAALLVS